MRNVCGFLMIFCFVLTAKIICQNKTIDSLKLALKNAKHDTTRCNILNSIIELETDDNVWPIYNEQLKNLSKTKAALNDLNKNIYLRYLAASINNNGYLANLKGNLEMFFKTLSTVEPSSVPFTPYFS